MAMAKIREYIQAREGKEVSWDELITAELAPSPSTLNADLTRLVADPRNGITRVGDERVKGVHRGYRYDKPAEIPPAEFIRLRLIGRAESGNHLAQDDGMRIYEIVPVGRMHVRLAEQPA